MSKLDLERRRMRASILGTALLIPAVLGVYLEGLEWVAVVASLGFMVGYLFERVRLHRTIADLLVREHGPSPRESWTA